MSNLSKRTTVNRPLNGDGWGMGFLLVFFPQNDEAINSSQPLKPHTVNAVIKRSTSTNLVAKAQSTISICALVVVFTLLMFTLSTFEPNNTMSSHQYHYRRHLTQLKNTQLNTPALQGLGVLYSRGTKAMNDVVLCHVPESVTLLELKMFLRAFHVSGLLSKADIIFIFPFLTSPEFYNNIIRDEIQLFLKLIRRYKFELSNGTHVSNLPASFELGQFVRPGKVSDKDPIWGRKNKSGAGSNSSKCDDGETELTRTSYGSVVGFGVGELDPENVLSGFMDHVPMGLRRWATYPMLLGRVRRNFKHVMLVDVKEVLVVGDPLARVRLGSPESVFLASTPGRHHRKVTDRAVNPSVIYGGARGVRRLSAAMLTETVRATTHNKRKVVVSELALLNRLVTNEVVNKNVHFVASGESIQEASSLSSLGGVVIGNNTVVRRGNSNIDIELTKHICSFSIEASVYKECKKVQPF